MSVQLNFIDYLQKDEELEKKKNLTNKQKPKMVSLFSGCGGMDLGFKQAGYDIIYANDFDEDAQKIYELNLGKIDVYKRQGLYHKLEEIKPDLIFIHGIQFLDIYQVFRYLKVNNNVKVVVDNLSLIHI